METTQNKQEIENSIIDLETKNANMKYVIMALGLAGGIAGVIYASKKGKGFWGKVGYYIVGSASVTIPVGLMTVPRINKNKAEIEKLRVQKEVSQTKEG